MSRHLGTDPKSHEKPRWWKTPKTIIVEALAVLAGAAGAVDHFDTLKKAFSFGPAEQAVTINNDSTLEFSVNVTKSGPSVLHNCKFDIWADSSHMTVTYPPEPITIPNGDFFLQTYVFSKLPKGNVYVTDDGKLSLICDSGGSDAYSSRSWIWMTNSAV
jgi:hypothetical protein